MELKEILKGIQPVDEDWIEKAKARTAQLVMPPRALGRLHEISERLCGIQQTLEPSMEGKAVLVMAGDHGVVEEGVSAFPQEVTGQMVRVFLGDGAGISVLARHAGAEVWIADMGIIPDIDPGSIKGGERLWACKVARGTANLAKGPAMTRQEAEKAVVTGFQMATGLFRKGISVLGTGDMGIGNTTPSAVIGAVIARMDPVEMVGPGTGINSKGLQRKLEAVRQGIEVNIPDPGDGLDVLSKVGGFEIGGIAGCVLAGAYHGHPVVIDGFISTAGALVAHALCPDITGYLFAGHCSKEPGHRIMLNYLGLDPILDLEMRLGEGTGAVLAMGIMQGAVRIFREMLTFEQASVSAKD